MDPGAVAVHGNGGGAHRFARVVPLISSTVADYKGAGRAADAILLGAVGWNGPDGAPVTMRDGQAEKMAREGYKPSTVSIERIFDVKPEGSTMTSSPGLSTPPATVPA